jgi:aromatic ring-opening dioxygenase catalytic subunit (LigB family)
VKTERLPTYFISHGGGPWPYMMEQSNGMYDRLAQSLRDMPRQLGERPKAVLVISAHWEEREFTVMAAERPPMVYDYFGFPAHTYYVQYPAPGLPALAGQVQQLIQDAGFAARLDARRGFDHGSFVPLVVMYPQADVPVVQLSLRAGYDPAAHLAVGRALAPLREQGVLIVGSGLSDHNLRRMGPAAAEPSRQFDDWLQQTLLATEPQQRAQRLIDWQDAPAARVAHPQEDHLLPLMVAVGAAGDDEAVCVYHEDGFYGGVTVSSFRFGQGPVAQV